MRNDGKAELQHYVPQLLLRLHVNNPGARVSAAGFAIVVAQAESDPELAVETGIRVDLPSGLRHQLLHNRWSVGRSGRCRLRPCGTFEQHQFTSLSDR